MLKGLALIRCHNKMLNVLVYAAHSISILCKWALKFKLGGMSTEDDLCNRKIKIAPDTPYR